jgi:cell wall-associated NlpC family hydrolase
MVDYQALLGKQWKYGVNDCFSLVRDYFRLQGIQLPNFKRPADLETCESIFLLQAKAYGFVEVEFAMRKPGDVLIMRLGTATPMHAAILLENEQILHQRQDSLSTVEGLTAYHVKKVAAVFRYDADRQAAG